MKNKTKKLLLALSLGSMMSATTFAEDKQVSAHSITGNVTLASDYVWRGLTQTDDEPAIQGGFDYAHESGFAAGVWGSNVDFNSDASAEFDLYASYAGEMDGFGYEVGYIAYRYPSEAGLNFEEVYVGGSYGGLNLTYYAGLSDFSNGTDVENYVEVSYGTTFEDIDFSVTYGDYDNVNDFYGIGIGKSFVGLDFALSYTDADIDGDGDQSNVVFSISKSF